MRSWNILHEKTNIHKLRTLASSLNPMTPRGARKNDSGLNYRRLSDRCVLSRLPWIHTNYQDGRKWQLFSTSLMNGVQFSSLLISFHPWALPCSSLNPSRFLLSPFCLKGSRALDGVKSYYNNWNVAPNRKVHASLIESSQLKARN